MFVINNGKNLNVIQLFLAVVLQFINLMISGYFMRNHYLNHHLLMEEQNLTVELVLRDLYESSFKKMENSQFEIL